MANILSPMEPLRISAYIHFIFIANKGIGLHFPSNDIGLSSLKFLWWAPELLFTLARGGVSAVQRHPRSLMLVPIENADMTSY